ncbi:hypothetical protein COCMIDRAFT_99922 [Bipolaris oryzae ATCC 44560]|uniref:Uncharacterized protein n=1 Tax=Bipolaris oryzae ATCC 44560 TaxID=930090 RepID=W6Z1G7_COCMI|nr:uncharacterized protein COCMIDRAFT_99922 [Bipolaris oryzae ATCC 44560]EUC43795.1 hypothetical protein COCMIDRAFT_99922 [Bipolaris oryzae ATCC 44560]
MSYLPNLKVFKKTKTYKTAQTRTTTSPPDTYMKQSATQVMHAATQVVQAPTQVKHVLTQVKHSLAQGKHSPTQDKHAPTLATHPSIHTPTPISKKLETSEEEDVMNMIKPHPEEVDEHWDEMECLTEDREWTDEQLMDEARPGRRHAA